MATELDFAVVANNNKSIYVQVLDANGNPLDISGYSIKWQARLQYGSPALITKSTAGGTLSLFNPTIGIFAIPILAADTKGMAQGSYIHEAVTVDGSGNPVTITNDDPLLSFGTMYVRQQYTAQ